MAIGDVMKSRAYEGVVPGITWAQFTNPSNYKWVDGAQPMTGEASGDPATKNIYGTYNLNGDNINAWLESGGGPLGGPAGVYGYYGDALGDGTRNVYSEGPNGEVISKNETQNDDSWWDSTGIPLVASLAFGGVTGLASAAGYGIADGAAGLANVGYGASSLGLPASATTLSGSAGGGLSSWLSQAGDGGGGADAVANGATGGGGVAESQTPSFLDSLKEGWTNLGNQWGQINPLLRTAITSGAGELVNLGGSDTPDSGSTALPQYDTSNNGTVTYNDGGRAGLGLQPGDTGAFDQTGSQGSNYTAAPSPSGSSGSNPFSALTRLYNTLTGNGGQGANADDYWNLASTLGRLGSGVLGYNAANNAANTLSNATTQANDLNRQIYNDSTTLNAPYVSAGAGAINKLSALNGLNGADAQSSASSFLTSDPGYQFRLTQGLNSAQRSAAAGGSLMSGSTLKALNDYAQGQASQEYGDAYNRLYNVAGLGQASANKQTALGSAFADSTGSNLLSGASAQAAGTVGGANQITSALSSLFNNYGSNNAILKALGMTQTDGYYQRTT